MLRHAVGTRTLFKPTVADRIEQLGAQLQPLGQFCEDAWTAIPILSQQLHSLAEEVVPIVRQLVARPPAETPVTTVFQQQLQAIAEVCAFQASQHTQSQAELHQQMGQTQQSIAHLAYIVRTPVPTPADPQIEEVIIADPDVGMIPPQAVSGPRVNLAELPDECFFIPPQRNNPKFRTHSTSRNVKVHSAEAQFADDLHQASRMPRKSNAEILKLKDVIAELSNHAADVAQARLAEFMQWIPANSINRGRMVAKAYLYAECGLIQLAAAVMAEKTQLRYADNAVIQWLIALLADSMAEGVINKHDAAERWLINAEAWLARDADSGK